MVKIAISACLLGDNVRYDGMNKRNDELIKIIKDYEIIKFCPESLALKTPRKPIEILNGHIVDEDGNDYTSLIEKANSEILGKIKECDIIIAKSKSPTCGYKQIYDGTFSSKLIKGNGTLIDKLLKMNKVIFTENDLKEIKDYLNNHDS